MPLIKDVEVFATVQLAIILFFAASVFSDEGPLLKPSGSHASAFKPATRCCPDGSDDEDACLERLSRQAIPGIDEAVCASDLGTRATVFEKLIPPAYDCAVDSNPLAMAGAQTRTMVSAPGPQLAPITCGVSDLERKRQIMAIASLGFYMDAIIQGATLPGDGDCLDKFKRKVQCVVGPAMFKGYLQKSLNDYEMHTVLMDPVTKDDLFVFLPVGADTRSTEKYIFAAMYYSQIDLVKHAQSLVELLNKWHLSSRLPFFISQYQKYAHPSPPNCDTSAPQAFVSSLSGAAEGIQLRGSASAPFRAANLMGDYSTTVGSSPGVGVGYSAGGSGMEAYYAKTIGAVAASMMNVLRYEGLRHIGEPAYIITQNNLASRKEAAKDEARSYLTTHAVKENISDAITTPNQALSRAIAHLKQNPQWDNSSFLSTLSKLPADSAWTAALANQAKSLIDHSPKENGPQADLIEFNAAVGALKVAIAATSTGATTLARQSYELSTLIETFRRNPKAMAEICGSLPVDSDNILALRNLLVGRDTLANRDYSAGERFNTIAVALPDFPTKKDQADFATAISMAGYPRMDLVAAADMLGSIHPSLAFSELQFEGLRADAPYFIEKTLRARPDELPKIISNFQKIPLNQPKQFYDTLREITRNVNRVSLLADKARNLLSTHKVSSRLSSEAVQVLNGELDHLETISRETLIFGSSKAANDALKNLSEKIVTSVQKINDFILGVGVAVSKNVYQLGDVAKAVWDDPGIFERGILDSVTNPAESTAKVFDNQAKLIRLAQSAPTAAAAGEAYANLAIGTFFLAEGSVTVSNAALAAARESLVFRRLGQTLAKTPTGKIAAKFAPIAERESTTALYGPAHPEGPLHKIKTANGVAATNFRSSTYVESVTKEPIKLYRAYGGVGREESNWWTTIKPTGPLQLTVDAALDPNWGNTAIAWTEITVPIGTKIYEGVAASIKTKAGGQILGGTPQVFLTDDLLLQIKKWTTDQGAFR